MTTGGRTQDRPAAIPIGYAARKQELAVRPASEQGTQAVIPGLAYQVRWSR